MVKVPNLKFNNGQDIPILGLGTWKSSPGEVTQVIKDAVDIGYRHFDCAMIYRNEKEIGESLASIFAAGKIKREDLFITSKLWNTYHNTDSVEIGLKKTLNDLGLDYLDLFLMHWPMAFKDGNELVPKQEDGSVIFSDMDYVDTWKAMEKLQEKGLTKSIGLSNFNEEQIDRVLKIAKIKPVNNQIECHPFLNQSKLVDYCKSKGITVTAYSPLGAPNHPYANPNDPKILQDSKLKELADKYGKSPAQILLRYQVDRGVIIVPKSVNRTRLEQNIDIFDFALDREDLIFLNSFDRNGRVNKVLEAQGHPYYPFR